MGRAANARTVCVRKMGADSRVPGDGTTSPLPDDEAWPPAPSAAAEDPKPPAAAAAPGSSDDSLSSPSGPQPSMPCSSRGTSSRWGHHSMQSSSS
jgi:hypothetical protein